MTPPFFMSNQTDDRKEKKIAFYMAIFNYDTGTHNVDFFKDENTFKVMLRDIIRDYCDDSDEFEEITDGVNSISDYVQLIEETDSDMRLVWGKVPSSSKGSQIENDVLNRFVEEANQWPDNRDDEPLVESFPGYTPILTVGDIRKVANLKSETEITF